MTQNRALLIVDVQNDFCEGGALAVQGGNKVAEGVADLLINCSDRYTRVFASQDWHNPLPDLNGGHFAAPDENPNFVTSWPVHCVAGTFGAEIHPALLPVLSGGQVIGIRKGQGRPDYSAFQGTAEVDESLAGLLVMHGVRALDVVGIATDHCVLASGIDALSIRSFGFLDEVRILTDLVAGVDGVASMTALDRLHAQGAVLADTATL